MHGTLWRDILDDVFKIHQNIEFFTQKVNIKQDMLSRAILVFSFGSDKIFKIILEKKE